MNFKSSTYNRNVASRKPFSNPLKKAYKWLTENTIKFEGIITVPSQEAYLKN